MRDLIIGLIVLVVVTLRLARRRRRTTEPRTGSSSRISFGGDVGLIMSREIRERFRGRVFRVTTIIVLLVVAGAIVIPTLSSGKARPEQVGVVGPLSTSLRATVISSAKSTDVRVHVTGGYSANQATADLRSGRLDVALVDEREVIVKGPLSSSDTSASAELARAIAENLGIAEAFQSARLTPTQAATLEGAKALPVMSLQHAKSKPVDATALIGAILIFVMLSQYNTWILMGVMEEKSSRVIEVLLSAVRPMRLLTGKVLGIGVVALAQAMLIVLFALVLAKAVGSTILHGTEPLVVVSTLVWLILGYTFYCWVYAAAGSMVERQDQVQTLVLPLSLPMLFGYIVALTGATSGSPTELVKVLAYLPPTAPFDMTVLVGFSAVTWWQFLGSVLISVVCTVGVARGAAIIYRRAILRTGARVRLRDVISPTTR